MMKCNFMFAKNSKAYSVYLLFRFVCSLAVSMSTVLSIVYHLEVVQLDAFQLVLVGTVQETSCFLFEMPTGVVADLYSRRRSVLIGMFLYGLGFLMEGALPWFAPVLLAQVVWGCGDTFITGALEAWIASEEEDKPIDKVFLLAGLMRTIKEPVLAAWMNDHVDEKMRATVFSTSGQLDSFGQIIGGPIVGLVAQQVSIPWGLVCTAFLLLPALFLVPVAGKKRD